MHGDCLDKMRELPSNHIDSIVTDPPYGLAFMGKKWDYDVPTIELWNEVLRVLKPGGHLLSFGGTRTYHRMVVNIEDAGFEIRDQLQWLYGSGFPKSHNVSKGIDKKFGAKREIVGIKQFERSPCRSDGSVGGNAPNAVGGKQKNKNDLKMQITAPSTDLAKQWDGYGTALKPSNEPIVLARKPLSEKTIVDNVLKWGTGALNIDGCRIGTEIRNSANMSSLGCMHDDNWVSKKSIAKTVQGRWPANTLFDHAAAQMLDEQSGILKSGEVKQGRSKGTNFAQSHAKKISQYSSPSSKGGASRFFFNCFSTESEVLNHECENTSARTVALFLKTIHQTIDSIAQPTVDIVLNAKFAQHVRCAGIQCDSCTTSIAADIVKMQTLNFGKVLSPILDCITDCKNSILHQNLASLAELKEDTDTTEIIQSLSKLFGSVLLVTDANIKRADLRNVRDQCRFLYQAKASKSERGGSTHPTMKPIKLMQYLCRLITPPNGIILDPFMGSGTTGLAALNESFDFIGIEKDNDYYDIAVKRISAN